MEMDIGAKNYPFQCFLCFLTFEITPKFSFNQNKTQKIYFEPQLFNNRKICLTWKLLTKLRSKKRFYTQTLVKLS